MHRNLLNEIISKTLYITSFLASPILQTFLIGYRGIVDAIGLLLFLTYLVYEKIVYKNNLWLLFIIGLSIGFFFELIGVNYGIPFGKYEYTAFSSTTILSVPIPIVFAWGIYITVTYQVCRYLLNKLQVKNNYLIYVITPFLMVNIDIAVDPLMVERGLWRWAEHFPFKLFEIPLTNFVGWYITSFLMLTIYLNICKVNPDAVGERPLGSVFPLSYVLIYLPLILEAMREELYIYPVYLSLLIYCLLIILLYILQLFF